MSSEILFSDGELLVVNKPAGLPTIPDGWEQSTTCLRDQLAVEFGRVWVVHRLDKITSGVIVFARNAEAHRSLSLLFETHQVTKRYRALVCGLPDWKEMTSQAPLRADVGHRHRTAVDWKRGQPAVTRFLVRQGFAENALIEACPETGRTHQIRAHAYAIGFPILADRLYGAPPTDLIARPALHAHSLEFPFAGQQLAFTAPYPEDFAAAMNALGHTL